MNHVKLLLTFCMFFLHCSSSAMQAFKKVTFPKNPFAKRYFSANTKKNIDLDSLANIGHPIESEIQEPVMPKEGQNKLGKPVTVKVNDQIVKIVEDIDSLVPKQPSQQLKTKYIGFFSLYNKYAQKLNDSIVEVVEDIDSIVPKQPGQKTKEQIITKYNKYTQKLNGSIVKVVEDIDSIVPKQPVKKAFKKLLKKINKML